MAITLLTYFAQAHMRARCLAELGDFCRIPSISARGDDRPMVAAAQWLVRRMEHAGINARFLPVAGGFPIVYGEARGRSSKTILFYNHYDVQPPEPLEEWSSDPFLPTERDGLLYARGVADNKGSLLSRIHAVEALRQLHEGLPVNVKFLVEGEEESGSRHLDAAVQAHHDVLRADAAIWENARRDDLGRPTTSLGNKGICVFELRAKTAKMDTHSGFAPLYPNAAWRLTWALVALKDQGGRVKIPGFYTKVRPLTTEDERICRTVPANVEEQKARLGLKTLLPGDDPVAVNRAYFYEPAMTIQGLSSGYTGPGENAAIPSRAMARLDCRLVLDQDPDEIFALIRTYLKDQDFDDIEVEKIEGYRPMRTPLDHPFVEVVADSCRQVYGQDLVILPTTGGTSPRYVFRHVPDMPILNLGVSYMDCRQHAPNENIRIEDYFLGAAHIAAIQERFSRP